MKCERCGEKNPAEIHTCTPQEPVAWVWTVNSGAGYITRGVGFDKADIPFAKHTPLYTAPPQRQQRTYTLRKWQGLTDGEMSEAYNVNYNRYGQHVEYADFVLIYAAIEAKLKEKNSA